MAEKVVTQEQIKEAGALLKREHLARVTAEQSLEKLSSEKNLRERAEKVAFKEVELGLAEPYKTHDEFQSKVASLMQDDLDVVEKALSRGYHKGNRDGELDNSGEGSVKTALDPFAQTLMKSWEQ